MTKTTTNSPMDVADYPLGLPTQTSSAITPKSQSVVRDGSREETGKQVRSKKVITPPQSAKYGESTNSVMIEAALQSSKTLASLVPEAIPRISDSNVFALVQMQVSELSQPVYRRVEIPKRFQSCPIYRALLHFYKTAESVGANPMLNYRKALQFDKMGTWASEEYPNAKHLPKAVFQDYARYLRNVQKIHQNSICVYMSGYRSGLESFLEHAHGNSSLAETAATVREAIAFIPSVSNRAAKPRDSLAQITNQDEKDESKLLRSAILYCCNFLKLMNEQRQELLSIPEVAKELDSRLHACGGNYKELKYVTSEYHRGIGYKELAAAILNSNNLQLKERLLHNNVAFCYSSIEKKLSMSVEDTNAKIREGLWKSGTLNVQPDNIDTKLYFHNIDFLFLVKHTPSEETAFAWLLATDRIQSSGVARMKLEDLRITPTTASPIYIKGRSEQSIREVPMHYKKTMQYQAYVDFKQLKLKFLERFPEIGDSLLDLPAISNYQAIDGTIYRPLLMAAFQHTEQYQVQLGLAPESEAFADILRRVAANNSQILRARASKGRPATVSTSDAPIPKRQTISITAIAQSRAIIDDDDGEHFENEAFEKYSQTILSADATAHSAKVKEVIYKHASETKYRLDKRGAFATSVGQMMVDDAKKVQAAIREEEIVKISELKVMLGWSEVDTSTAEMEEFDLLLSSAQELGFKVSPFGELEKDGVRYIINNAVSAALLMDYRNECISQIERMTAEDELKAFAIAMQAAHIDNALERFDRRTVREGSDILKKSKFPTPIIR